MRPSIRSEITALKSHGHVEIIGGGIAGLTAAAVLAGRGFEVTVNERSSELREIGAGIYLKQNSIQVLRALGLLEELKAIGERLLTGEIRDNNNEIILKRDLKAENAYTVMRGDLHRMLADAALRAGATIRTSAEVEGATPDGELIFASGERRKADFVIGADGVNSKIRDLLGLTLRRTALPDGAIRLVIPRLPGDPVGLSVENWSGRCRIGVVPCSREYVYMFLIGPECDADAKAVPVHRDYWTRKFPHVAHFVERISDDVGRHDRHSFMEVNAWSLGEVAIIGDAAHAQPPNLGQGAGMSIANAFALAEHLSNEPDTHRALLNWEQERRPVSEMVQRWSRRYGALGYNCPAGLFALRSSTIRGIGRIEPARRKWGWLWRGGMDLEAA